MSTRLGEHGRVVLGAAADDAGAVDDDVELAEPVDERAHGVAVAHVEAPHVDAGVAARGGDLVVGRAGRDDGVARRRERARDAGADAARGAGDENATRRSCHAQGLKT